MFWDTQHSSREFAVSFLSLFGDIVPVGFLFGTFIYAAALFAHKIEL